MDKTSELAAKVQLLFSEYHVEDVNVYEQDKRTGVTLILKEGEIVDVGLI